MALQVTPKTLLFNRSLGITAMEMGIQTTNDEIHRLTKRDSTRAQLVNRAELCKQFGFKVLPTHRSSAVLSESPGVLANHASRTTVSVGRSATYRFGGKQNMRALYHSFASISAEEPEILYRKLKHCYLSVLVC